jgi:hypothetical protein
MNSYRILKEHQQAEVNALPIKFAFSNKQFEEAMAEWGLTPKDTDKLYMLGGTGGFYLRTDAEKIQNTLEKIEKEKKLAIQQDKTGNGFIFNMFNYELANHEYCITYDTSDTLDALGLTDEEVNNNPALLHGLKKAIAAQCQE